MAPGAAGLGGPPADLRLAHASGDRTLCRGAGPVAEEALFRGILFPALRDAGWPRAAYLVASVGFGLIHANRAAFLPLSLLGGFLAWLYVRTGNLLAPVAAHVVFNLTPFVLLAAGVDFSS